MKKFLSIIIIFLMTITLFACSEEANDKTENNISDNEIENGLDEEENEVDEDTENDEDSMMTFDIADLPEGYPKDIVPIIDSGDVEAGMMDGNQMLAKVYCKEEDSKVFEYYLDIMKASEGFKQDDMGGVYFLDGVIDGYTISIKITSDTYYDGYLTSLTITVE